MPVGNPLRRVVSGEPIEYQAATHNAFCYAAERANGGGRGERPPARPVVQSGIVLVRNNTGAAVADFAVLGLGEPLIDPATSLEGFQEAPRCQGETPSLADHVGKFGVLLEPLGVGDIGPAVVAGVTVAKLHVVHTRQKWADVAAGSTLLRSSHAGSAKILWKQPGTGEVWAEVRLGAFGPHTVQCQTLASGSEGDLVSVQPYGGPVDDVVAIGDPFDALLEYGDVEAGIRVTAAWDGWLWRIVAQHCGTA